MTSDAPRSSARPHGNRVNFFQLVALLLAFVLVAAVGGVLAAGLFIPAAAGAKAITETTTQVFDDLPTELEPGPLAQSSTFYYSDGKTVLAQFYDENRTVVPLSKIAPIMQQAMVATEDKRFFEHGGIDVEGTTRALVNNLTKKDEGMQGGSTLTQQYVKNVLIEQAVAANDPAAVQAAREPTTDRKLRELKLAISLETRLSKQQILEGYLNIAQFGSKVYGVEAAARYYFSTTAAKLTPIQAATIAGITQAPSQYDPTLHPKDSQRKRNLVLNDMYEQGYIDKTEYDKDRNTPIEKTLKVSTLRNGCQAAADAAFFCDYVTRVISNNDDGAFSSWGKTADARLTYLKRGGLKIVTTLDVDKEKVAAAQVKAAVPVSKKLSTTTDINGNRIKLQLESALTSVEPGTGRIEAMAQNRPYDASSNTAKGATSINFSADQAHGGSQGFSPGSSFKVFALAEWLKEGRSLYQTVNGTPRSFPASAFRSSCGGGWPAWNVHNSDGGETGPMSVMTATWDSVNAAYADMETRLDLCGIKNTAESMGFRGSLTGQSDVVLSGPAMILGTQNTSPLQQSAAYATLASGGTYCSPIAIESITSSTGDKLQVPSAHCDSDALDPKIAATVTYALQGVLKSGSAAGDELADGRPGVGKTGTAQGSQAAWFVGYTPQLSTAVWVGNAEVPVYLHDVTVAGSKYVKTQQDWMFGGTISAPTWKAYMDAVLKDEPKTAFPAPDWSVVNAPKPPPAPPKDSGSDKGDSGSDKGSDDKGGDQGGSGSDKGGSGGSGSDSGGGDKGGSGDGGSSGGGGASSPGKGGGHGGGDQHGGGN